ncbi:MAG TPA: hypothetical protein VMJ74_06965 [Pseudomonadales bacterium]|nr:hypothetical protein [Pseudomonadales bacterium]
MNISQYPNADQIAALLGSQETGPVVMVNLLKFKDRADAPDAGLSGKEAYAKYADAMVALVQQNGGRLIWSGRLTGMVIGASDVPFDMVALIEYRSRQAFAALVQDARVQAIGVHRAAGLEGQWLIAASQEGVPQPT